MNCSNPCYLQNRDLFCVEKRKMRKCQILQDSLLQYIAYIPPAVILRGRRFLCLWWNGRHIQFKPGVQVSAGSSPARHIHIPVAEWNRRMAKDHGQTCCPLWVRIPPGISSRNDGNWQTCHTQNMVIMGSNPISCIYGAWWKKEYILLSDSRLSGHEGSSPSAPTK